MHNIEPYDSFLNEDINTDIVQAKLKLTELKEKIVIEVAEQKDADNIEDKAKSIDAQATLYQKMPALLRDLARAMKEKGISGDIANIY